MIGINYYGSFVKTERFLENLSKRDYMSVLRMYGEKGVEALREATPKDTGKTSESWSYEIEKTSNGYSIHWHNSNRADGLNIALLLQYGHATQHGVYVQGIDYINPALQKVFTEMADALWKEVKTA